MAETKINSDRSDREENLDKFQLSLYLLPVIGIIPALWSLSSHQSNVRQKKVSHVSVTLVFLWLSAYSILWLGANTTSQLLALRLLYLNGILTTSYFLTCTILMVRIWQGKIPRLPSVTKIFRKER